MLGISLSILSHLLYVSVDKVSNCWNLLVHTSLNICQVVPMGRIEHVLYATLHQ